MDMHADNELAGLMNDPNANCWIGPSRHIMGYPVRKKQWYNLVMSHPGSLAGGKIKETLDLKEMRDQFKSFEPRIRKALTHVKTGVKWQLGNLPLLPTWISKSGRVVLMGDAAHAMVPFLAQV